MRRIAALLILCLPGGPRAEEPVKGGLDLATTTSVRDSGLFDELLPLFIRETGIEVRLVAVGSGAALRMGEEGNADVLVTHAPEDEEKLVARGALLDRRLVMKNYFLLAGPPEDPAGMRGAESAVAAMKRLAEKNAPYASRADESGTHKREQDLWRQAGLDPEQGWPAVVRTGAGMGATLQVAGEKRAYVLADLATFRAFRARIELEPLTRPDDPGLLNLYSVSRPNPERFPAGQVDVQGALRIADWLVSPATQKRIGAFGANDDGSLFTPAAAERAAP